MVLINPSVRYGSYTSFLQKIFAQTFGISNFKAISLASIVSTKIWEQIKCTLQRHGMEDIIAILTGSTDKRVLCKVILRRLYGVIIQCFAQMLKFATVLFTWGTDNFTPSNAFNLFTRKSLLSLNALTIVATCSPPAWPSSNAARPPFWEMLLAPEVVYYKMVAILQWMILLLQSKIEYSETLRKKALYTPCEHLYCKQII